MTASVKTERPILFSGEMVRAILDGRKTQTRRVVDFKRIAKQTGCTKGRLAYSPTFESWGVFDGNGAADLCLVDCPYGAPGDTLWVRETCMITGTAVSYRADGEMLPHFREQGCKWRPSIHMPRWAARILLEVTAVRVERLQEISEADAIAEGCKATHHGDGSSATDAYQYLWDSINGKREGCSWDANPWVWVIEFRQMPTPEARL
jgi:hypothetical protein